MLRNAISQNWQEPIGAPIDAIPGRMSSYSICNCSVRKASVSLPLAEDARQPAGKPRGNQSGPCFRLFKICVSWLPPKAAPSSSPLRGENPSRPLGFVHTPGKSSCSLTLVVARQRLKHPALLFGIGWLLRFLDTDCAQRVKLLPFHTLRRQCSKDFALWHSVCSITEITLGVLLPSTSTR